MKIIDLLNKIANEEQVPKNIKHQYYDYKWNVIDKDYQKSSGEMLFGNMNIQYHLNDEIKLTEDNNIDIDIEKLEELEIFEYVDEFDEQEVEVNRYEINRLIRAVKQLNREIKELKEK